MSSSHGAVLAGRITTTGGYERTAELGHAALWDPLFFAWGLCLAAGLVLTRRATVTPYFPARKSR